MAGKDFDRFVNLDSIAGGFFRDAVVGHVSVYCEVFDERLVSVYVWGSVHRNEAVPGVSDLDLHPFVLDSVTDAGTGSSYGIPRHPFERSSSQLMGL